MTCNRKLSDGFLSQVIWQRDQLLNVFRQGLYHGHTRVSDWAAAPLAGQSQRSRRGSRVSGATAPGVAYSYPTPPTINVNCWEDVQSMDADTLVFAKIPHAMDVVDSMVNITLC